MSLLRMRTLLTIVVGTAVLAGVAGAAPARPDLVLGVEWRAGGGQLAWRSATTLAAQGRTVNVGGASVGLRALSPDGTLAALARTDGQLRLLRLRPLRSLGTLQTGGKHIPATVWPTRDRLVAVAGGAAPAVVVVDPGARRIVGRTRLAGALYGATAAGDRLVAVLAPSERTIGTATLAVVAANGSVRTVALPGVAAGFVPSAAQAGTGRQASPGLALSPDGRSAAVAGREAVVVVDLETLRVSRRPVRTLSRASKRVEGWSRSVVWLRNDRVAVLARTQGYEGDAPVATTSGVRLHVLGTGRTRTLDETATGAVRVGDTLLAYGGSALRGYTLDGSLRFQLLSGQDSGYVQTAGRYAYVGSANSTRFVVVDVAAGRVVSRARTAKPTVVLGS